MYLERQNDRYGGLEAQRVRAPDVVELGGVELERAPEAKRGREMGGEGQQETAARRYGAPRIGDVSAVRAAALVAEGVARVYRPDVVPTGTLADVLA